jgi:hypothetical protein
MKTKTAYRPKNIPTGEPPNIPPEREDPPQPSETTRIEFTNGADPDPVEVKVAAIEPAPPADEATAALLKQLDSLRASEALQRQHAAQMAAPAPTLPPGRADRLSLWKAHGNLSDEDAAFLEARPDMVDNPQLTRAAYAATLQAGIERDSPDFAAAMEGNFASLLNRAQAQPAPTPTATAFFAPPPPAASPGPPPPSSYVSAPPSRGTASYETGQRPARQIKLTPQEQEFARIAGVSDVEFAKQKQKLILAKAAGDYGEQR